MRTMKEFSKIDKIIEFFLGISESNPKPDNYGLALHLHFLKFNYSAIHTVYQDAFVYPEFKGQFNRINLEKPNHKPIVKTRKSSRTLDRIKKFTGFKAPKSIVPSV
jgi:hypothetical protein